MKEIKAGQRIDAYNDGKASASRLVVVVVDDVVERESLSEKNRKAWRAAISGDFTSVFTSCVFYVGPKGETKQFWDWNCDRFIVGHILNDETTRRDPMLFARRPEGFGWYCVNWNYSLDVSGRTRKQNVRLWKAAAEECGRTMRWNAGAGRYDYLDKATGRKVEA